MARLLFIITFLILSLDLEARGGGGGGRRVGGGDFHPAESAAHPAMNRAAVRPLQRTPALSRAALNAADWEGGAAAAAGGGYVDDNAQPIQIELPSITNPTTTTPNSNSNSNQ